MSELIINETPVRTSKNFGINEIKLKDYNMPKYFSSFTNLTINNESSNTKIEKNKRIKKELKYGISKEFETQNNNNSNADVNIKINDKDKLYLEYNLDKDLVSNINIDANENSSSSVVIRFLSDDNVTKRFGNTRLTLNLDNNVHAQVVILNYLNKHTDSFLAIESNLKDDANLETIIVDFGADKSIINYYTALTGKNSDSKIYSVYIADKERMLDINYIAELYGEKANVDIDVQGALDDKAKKNFKGTIDFKKGAKKATGNESEYCMLLSPQAKSRALPMLLCTEDDVEGNHSSASGKVNKNELFYLMSRGFSQREALKLIIKARFTPIVEKIEDDEVKVEIFNQIDRRLD